MGDSLRNEGGDKTLFFKQNNLRSNGLSPSANLITLFFVGASTNFAGVSPI
jgi:hypothetical protein